MYAGHRRSFHRLTRSKPFLVRRLASGGAMSLDETDFLPKSVHCAAQENACLLFFPELVWLSAYASQECRVAEALDWHGSVALLLPLMELPRSIYPLCAAGVWSPPPLLSRIALTSFITQKTNATFQNEAVNSVNKCRRELTFAYKLI